MQGCYGDGGGGSGIKASCGLHQLPSFACNTASLQASGWRPRWQFNSAQYGDRIRARDKPLSPPLSVSFSQLPGTPLRGPGCTHSNGKRLPGGGRRLPTKLSGRATGCRENPGLEVGLCHSPVVSPCVCGLPSQSLGFLILKIMENNLPCAGQLRGCNKKRMK